MQTYINIWNCRAAIARDVRVGEHSWTVETCVNADELQAEILAEIERQGAAINISGRVPCPADLAAKAQWPD